MRASTGSPRSEKHRQIQSRVNFVVLNKKMYPSQCYKTLTNLAATCCTSGSKCDPRGCQMLQSEARFERGLSGESPLFLNPEVVSQNYSPSFYPVENQCNGICSIGYLACQDPTVIDVPRGITIPLDAPPLDSSIPLEDIYTDPRMQNYGKTFYNSYTDIKAGQILYSVNKAPGDPFYAPNFTKPNSKDNVGVVYTDPMGAQKPEYTYCPRGDACCVACPEKPCAPPSTNLSWIADSTAHREDLLARQMRTMNRTSFENRWF
jgi:hypothetical protein